MTTVNQLLKAKGAAVKTVTPDTPLYEALKVMAEHNIGAVPVAEAGNLVGIFSERDYARQAVLRDDLMLDTPVKQIMTKKVVYVRPGQTVEECMALMTDKHIRHLPVLVDNKMVGIVSIGDLVKDIISRQKFIIEQLENYIVSSG